MRPGIIHLSGRLKPWTYNARTPADTLYYEYLDRTLWHGWRPPSGWRSRLLFCYENQFRPWAYPLEV